MYIIFIEHIYISKLQHQVFQAFWGVKIWVVRSIDNRIEVASLELSSGLKGKKMDVSKNRGGKTPPQIIHLFIGFSIINHPFCGFSPIFGNTQMFLLDGSCWSNSETFTLPETNSSPLNMGLGPKRKVHRIPTIHSQVQTCC